LCAFAHPPLRRKTIRGGTAKDKKELGWAAEKTKGKIQKTPPPENKIKNRASQRQGVPKKQTTEPVNSFETKSRF
jgi:hypothetical protein